MRGSRCWKIHQQANEWKHCFVSGTESRTKWNCKVYQCYIWTEYGNNNNINNIVNEIKEVEKQKPRRKQMKVEKNTTPSHNFSSVALKHSQMNGCQNRHSIQCASRVPFFASRLHLVCPHSFRVSVCSLHCWCLLRAWATITGISQCYCKWTVNWRNVAYCLRIESIDD